LTQSNAKWPTVGSRYRKFRDFAISGNSSDLIPYLFSKPQCSIRSSDNTLGYSRHDSFTAGRLVFNASWRNRILNDFAVAANPSEFVAIAFQKPDRAIRPLSYIARITFRRRYQVFGNFAVRRDASNFVATTLRKPHRAIWPSGNAEWPTLVRWDSVFGQGG